MEINSFTNRISVLCLILFSFLTIFSYCEAQEPKLLSSSKKSDISLKFEVQHAIEKGLLWLKSQQKEGGFWSQPDHPALTALVLISFMGEPSGKIRSQQPSFVNKGYEYLKKCVKPDGGIYVKDIANYNTAVSMMAFLLSRDPVYVPLIKNARNFIVSLQGDFNEKGKIDSPYDGGIGYGSKYKHSDMSNTTFALEALYYTRYLKNDITSKKEILKELNWPAVRRFLQRSQNLPKYNDQSWASDDPDNKGGFIYFPGDSKAGEQTLDSGKKALRSYGSISYAGLLSYIYAQMEPDDPRVKAVFQWLQENYTLDENPGMGAQGLYYYYHMMAKALSIYNVDELTLKNGQKVNWRKDLSLKLLDLQKSDGFWVNESGRWWEKDPILVTSYSIIALEIIYKGL